jgi:predicted ATP-dependent protease
MNKSWVVGFLVISFISIKVISQEKLDQFVFMNQPINYGGEVEHESDMGTLVTDFTLIRGGALHRANGGYLVVPIKELLMNYFSWEGLKRALNNGEIIIEDTSERFGFMSAKSLKPESVPLNVQIILIGSPILYYLLYKWDEDFKELFRVKAEFDTSMPYGVRNANDFAMVISKIEREESLLPIDHLGVSKILEESLRLAEDQKRISIRFGELSKLLHEAHYYAHSEGVKRISDRHVEKAIEAKYYRSNLIQEKINELIHRKSLMIELKGMKTGQINGISVIDMGDLMFGRPNKITVNVASGKEGIIDIEREVKLGGPIHSKGVLILNGYIRDHYAQNKPISMMASLVFEQSYGEIEGDSASSAELYAILSGLSKLRIKQGIAVTGSVNQKGEVQPVGAINEKIEGYFEVCQQFGLNKEQGVIIPMANQDNLMLKPQVVKAVKRGDFHIWAVNSIDQGLEILTGCPAGRKLKGGSFTKNSIHYLVDQRFQELGENLKKKKK